MLTPEFHQKSNMNYKRTLIVTILSLALAVTALAQDYAHIEIGRVPLRGDPAN